MRPVFRPEPKLPVSAMQTYGIVAPVNTHFRQASCAEVECPHHQRGWRTIIDESTPDGQVRAQYVRTHSGRRFIEGRDDAGMTVFTFYAGQTCFRGHRAPLEREPLYLVQGGDWRANTGLIRRHTSADSWVDDFATHQQKIADNVNKG